MNEELIRKAAIKALAIREGWRNVEDVMRKKDGSFECGWHEQFYQDFKAGYMFAKTGEKV